MDRKSPVKWQILAFLEDNAGSTHFDIYDGIERDKDGVRLWLKRLHAEGMVCFTRISVHYTTARAYSITAKGRQEVLDNPIDVKYATSGITAGTEVGKATAKCYFEDGILHERGTNGEPDWEWDQTGRMYRESPDSAWQQADDPDGYREGDLIGYAIKGFCEGNLTEYAVYWAREFTKRDPIAARSTCRKLENGEIDSPFDEKDCREHGEEGWSKNYHPLEPSLGSIREELSQGMRHGWKPEDVFSNDPKVE
jgi:DNA-binding PadR family transcriptional regulator